MVLMEELQSEHATDGSDDAIMESAIGDDDAFVVFESGAVIEFEGIADDVGCGAAGFFDDEDAAGMIPDAFDVIGPGGQAEVDVGLTAGDDGVFGL